ncbi:MAG: MBOAT family protein [Chitinivibrionales bacterium]|nr:MBOAT family protein [Chitinivibrionales bacterium]
MLFYSFQFLIFFVIILGAYFTAPRRFRHLVLLAASYYFYFTWGLSYVTLLFPITLITFIIANAVAAAQDHSRKKLLLTAGIILNVGVLIFFKYFNFFNGELRNLFDSFGIIYPVPQLKFLLPVGLSFFIFKTISYGIDVYRGTIPAERRFTRFALYVSFFPQLLTGPIERAGNFLPQLDNKHTPDPGRFRDGAALFIWGLFKKMVIADNLATVVNWVYLAPQEYPGLALIVATYCYSFQIFCDFSGYSDMAIGAGRILGFSTMRNFNRPYAAISVSDFWRRWHISLSTWFRDYLYIPLGGSRVSLVKWLRNVMIVFVISGLWHGAGWTFILWGALHGIYLAGERLLAKPASALTAAINLDRYPGIRKALRTGLTFHLITFAWIFFRASSITDALFIVSHLFDGLSLTALNLFRQSDLTLAVVLIGFLLIAQFVRRKKSGIVWLMQYPRWIRWAAYTAMIIAIINLRPEFESGFIYLQF